MQSVFIVGIGMSKLHRPGSNAVSFPELVCEAVLKALNDAMLEYNAVDKACIGYVCEDSNCSQKVLHEFGERDIPIYDANNGSSTPLTALYMANQFIREGSSKCVLVVGFEKRRKTLPNTEPENSLTGLQCCPTSDGAAAVILVSEDFVKAYGLEHQAVEIAGMEMATYNASGAEDRSSDSEASIAITKRVAEKLFQETNISPTEVDVVELHGCFSNDMLTVFEALQLEIGGNGDNSARGSAISKQYVVNPSAGVVLRGHPMRATGVAQCVELCMQLRNEAGDRQVPAAKTVLQHNTGVNGGVFLALYKLGFPDFPTPERRNNIASESSAVEEDEKCTISYNFEVKNLADKSLIAMIGFKDMEETGICVQDGSIRMALKTETSLEDAARQAEDFLRNFLLKNTNSTGDGIHDGNFKANQEFLGKVFSAKGVVRSKL